MTWLLSLRAEAEHDLALARDWYREKRLGLEDEFLGEIGRAMRELEYDPKLHPLYYRNFRRALIRRFPYKMFYQVIDDRIVIFRLLHAKQEHRSRLE